MRRGSPGIKASPYDAVAEFYRRAWADWYLPSIRPFLKKFLFSTTPPGTSILDVCCGCGHVTEEVVKEGYRVTGIDSSVEMAARAKVRVPTADFQVKDARDFELGMPFEGALSTFDSLNHLLTRDDLCAAFRCVRQALRPGAAFVFDMNLEEAYAMDLGMWTRYSDESSIGFVRGLFDAHTKRARTELIWFEKVSADELWRRSDALVEEQCYSLETIHQALNDARFARTEYYTASEAGVKDELGFGRLYVRAWR
jgi:SAM-dependent methyltransferase